MYTYIYTYIHIYIYVFVHTYMHIHTYINLHIHIYIYMFIYKSISMCFSESNGSTAVVYEQPHCVPTRRTGPYTVGTSSFWPGHDTPRLGSVTQG